jgi:nucleotide-binding universal stress UspA family protein
VNEVGLETVENLLVPLDGSEFAERALPVAVRLARRFGAAVHLFSAVDKEDDVPGRTAQLARAAARLEGLTVREEVVVDLDPASGIHEALKRIGGGVVCMTSHGRARSAGVLGSVAAEVLARGHDPLVLVGPLFDEELEGTGIYAAVDETPGSASVVLAARHWAEMLGEGLTVLTIAEPVPPPVTVGPPRRRFGPDEDVDAFLRRVVGKVLGPEALDDVEVKAVYDPISPSVGLCTYLKSRPPWLVALSSRGRIGLERLVFGSVAAATVRCSVVPVLVVPRPDAR